MAAAILRSMPRDRAEALRRAAAVIREAQALAICTGAGMGVDSGLGTFRGRNSGVWAPLNALKVDFSEMSSPDWFDNDPRLAWAFWHFRYQAYTNSAPHEGYHVLAKWGQRMPWGFFSLTSNIDGHWERTPGVGPEKIYECHGALTHVQLVQDDGRIWPTDADQMVALDVPAWDLEPGEDVEARLTNSGRWVSAKVAENGSSLLKDDGTTPLASADAVRRPGPSGEDLMRVREGSPLPTCPQSGGAIRPNVLMFGDWGVNVGRIDEQGGRFRTWLRSVPADAPLVIVEVGAGTAVPTVRRAAEGLAGRANATLVRINWDDSEAFLGNAISIGGIGAKDALTCIDMLLQGDDEPQSSA